MEFKETKLETYTGEKKRIQLLKITKEGEFIPYFKNKKGKLEGGKTFIIKYQIRINRKRVYTTGFEYDARKYFATVVQNDILQLKIY